MITFFYVEPENVGEDNLKIFGEEAMHITTVLRYKKGEVIEVVDGKGGKYKVMIASAEKNLIEGKILSKTLLENEPKVFLTLAQSIGKGMKMDWVIEKGTEIGVSSFIPLVTLRTSVQPFGKLRMVSEASPLGDEKEKARLKRWRRVAISSMKQSLRSVLPDIQKITTLDELLLKVKDFDLVLFGSLDEQAKKIKSLARFKKTLKKLLVIVGPEGGFTEEEEEKLIQAGAIPVNLGKRRLRTETAGIVFCALVLYKWGDLG
jgi:16S rRNA (uracil1498-N3)-methyltransferase